MGSRASVTCGTDLDPHSLFYVNWLNERQESLTLYTWPEHEVELVINLINDSHFGAILICRVWWKAKVIDRKLEFNLIGML